MATPEELFHTRGWVTFDPAPEVLHWADAARPLAERLLADPGLRSQWLRCGGTWFAGVNVFPNDDSGAVSVAGVPPLAGPAVDFIASGLGLAGFAWDRAQISICLPGYPKPWGEESDAAFRFRRDRDAAHVDGLLRDAARRRRLGETHDFILGIPLTDTPADASPLVVWEGSHEVMRRVFVERFAGIAEGEWGREDITDVYAAARRECFESLRRVPVHARPGEAYILHRLALHGIAPWDAGAGDLPRMIAYFRPDTDPSRGNSWWLDAP